MKRSTLFLLICLAVASSCSSDNTLVINGKITDPAFNGSKVYIVGPGSVKEVYEDSTTVRNSNFKFKLEADSMSVRSIRVHQPDKQAFDELVFIKEKGNLDVVMSSRSQSSGTRLNEMVMEWKKANFAYDSVHYENYYKSGTPGLTTAERDSILNLSDVIDSTYLSRMTGILEENVNNGIGLLFFKYYYEQLSPGTKKKILEQAGSEYVKRDINVWTKVMFDPQIPAEFKGLD